MFSDKKRLCTIVIRTCWPWFCAINVNIYFIWDQCFIYWCFGSQWIFIFVITFLLSTLVWPHSSINLLGMQALHYVFPMYLVRTKPSQKLFLCVLQSWDTAELALDVFSVAGAKVNQNQYPRYSIVYGQKSLLHLKLAHCSFATKNKSF